MNLEDRLQMIMENEKELTDWFRSKSLKWLHERSIVDTASLERAYRRDRYLKKQVMATVKASNYYKLSGECVGTGAACPYCCRSGQKINKDDLQPIKCDSCRNEYLVDFSDSPVPLLVERPEEME